MTTDQWQATNQAHLMAALADVRQVLLHRVKQSSPAGTEPLYEEQPADAVLPPLTPPSALEQLCTTFGLSDFERDLLLLCAGIELDSCFAPLCAAAQDDPQRLYPTFSLALATLPNAHWSALTPDAALRRWRLIEVGAGSCLTTSPLRIDERILHYLVGVSHLDERLMGVMSPVETGENLVLSHWQLAERLVAAWSEPMAFADLPILQLCGYETGSKQAIASIACHFLGLQLYAIAAYSLPTAPSDFAQFKLLWEREAILSRTALFINCDQLEGTDTSREAAILHLCEALQSPLILSTTERRKAHLRPMLAFDVQRPNTQEQRTIWETALGDTTSLLNGHVDVLATQFSLSSSVIQATCAQVKKEWQQGGNETEEASTTFNRLLWDRCRVQARPRLDDLAQRIDCTADWHDIVLADAQMAILRDMTAQVQQRVKVYEQWGFAGKSARGLGISSLFAGSSGTGKTMAAEVIARELWLDLYRIDLSAVVSKYIGETEKNLARIFDAAEMGGVILLFDEADALFGKRSEVKDAHDRHANVEVSYLLQRMEAFRGLSVLTTNLKSALDTAFLRRLRFVVQFPFPDADHRAEIWQRIFPKATPTQDLDYRKLGQLSVAGGNIRNIAINAAFIAAHQEQPVMMQHILLAAKAEYVKLERPLTDAEIRGWV